MRCGLLGEHLLHSYSPQIHACFGDETYRLFEIAPKDLEEFLQNGDFDGLNVTIPYKKAVLRFCTELSQTARETGSVNTILRTPNGLYGENTDVYGFEWLLARNGGIGRGEKALVLGSGGASLAVQTVLRRHGAECVVISRKGEDNYVNYMRHVDAAILINTTPVGMYPNNGETIVNPAALANLRCVLDLIYNPQNTRLLLDAQEYGIRCENGLAMLVTQAKRAREIWTGEKIQDTVVDDILCKLKKQMRNVILIGMPSSGKTTVGKRLAERMGREFLDSDEELEKIIGPIPAFLEKHGEAAFRRHESEVLSWLGKKSACVIATGGGCVTKAENEAFLRQNGILVRLERPLQELSAEGRPLSRDLSKLFAERDALYARFADITIANRDVERTVQTILEAVE